MAACPHALDSFLVFGPVRGVTRPHCLNPVWQIYYAQGGHDNLRTARKHYAQSLELNKGGNLRALFGLTAVRDLGRSLSRRAQGPNERDDRKLCPFVSRPPSRHGVR
jgi:hypothetical protein